MNRYRFWLAILSIVLGQWVCAQTLPVMPLYPFQAAEQQNARRQALQQDQAAIERVRQELQILSAEMPARMAALRVEQMTQAMVDQAQLDVDVATLRQQSLRVNIVNTERRIAELEKSIRDLEAQEQLLQNPAKATDDKAQQAEQLARTRQLLAQQRIDLALEKQNLSNLRSHLELAELRQSLTEQWLARVEDVYRMQQAQTRLLAQEELTARLEKKQQNYQAQANTLRQRLEQEQARLSAAEQSLLKTRLQLAESRAKMVQLQIRLSQITNELAQLESLSQQKQVRAKDLQKGLDQLQTLRRELVITDGLFRFGIPLAERQKQLLEGRDGLSGAERRAVTEEAKLIGAMLAELNQSREALRASLNQVQAVQAQLLNRYQERLGKDLLEREKLPRSAADWKQIMAGISDAPQVLLHQVRLSIESTIKAMMETSALRWLALIALELSLLWLMSSALRGNLTRTIEAAKAKEQGSFFGAFALTALQLVRQNLLGLYMAGALGLVLWLCRVPQPGLGIIMTLVLLWLGTKIPINLAWFLLADPQLPSEQQRPHLYRQIVWTLFAGAVLASVTILANLSDLAPAVTGVFDRLFMGYWVLAFVPVLRIRRLLVDLLAKRYGSRFWFINLRIVTLILPLSLLLAALLGFVGYLQLAWAIAWHWVVFIAVLIMWLSIQGLLKDLVILLKNYALTHSRYGLLWTQDVINPLHKLLTVLLLMGAGIALLRTYGWESTLLTATLQNFLERPLFNLGGTDITPWRILLMLGVVLLVVRFGQWGRTVAYRWIFSGIVDLGVRHSLSVFTQYAIVLIGFLVMLQVVGLDLTTFTVFAGAVGVGIGLGMQSIANNFISGLLLLIERPLRSGDTVQIGTSTGEISRIGMRSLTLKTWDNMEVIIPNTDVISNAFVNWTHTDTIIRTVLMVGASYDADPHQVKQVITEVLSKHKDILQDPPWAVLLWEFGDSALTFRVQYHVDFAKSNTLTVRSEVMFAIYDGFKKIGIKIPYPQRDLHIKEWPDSLVMERTREELNLGVSDRVDVRGMSLAKK